MKRICLVLAVITFGSIAATATNINFSLDGYCDIFELTLTGTPKVYLDGVHYTCGPTVLVGGFEHTIPGYGAWFDLSDPSYGYTDGLPYGLELLTNADTKKPCVWAYYVYYPGSSNALYNSGTCTYFKDDAERPNAQGGTPAWEKPQQ